MKKVQYHRVTFYSPGTFFSEESSKPIEAWDIKEALALAGEITERYNAKPFGFAFSTYEKLEGEELGDFDVQPKRIARSGMIYFNGKIRTAEEVLAGTDEKESILRQNVEWNNIKAVCQSIDPNNWMWTHEFHDKDLLVSPEGEILYGDPVACGVSK